jgi:hypothetical protein
VDATQAVPSPLNDAASPLSVTVSYADGRRKAARRSVVIKRYAKIAIQVRLPTLPLTGSFHGGSWRFSWNARTICSVFGP